MVWESKVRCEFGVFLSDLRGALEKEMVLAELFEEYEYVHNLREVYEVVKRIQEKPGKRNG